MPGREGKNFEGGGVKLKNDTKFAKVYICPDLTRKQQEYDKTLRDKVKEFKGKGMLSIKIVRGKVVREGASGTEVLFGEEL